VESAPVGVGGQIEEGGGGGEGDSKKSREHAARKKAVPERRAKKARFLTGLLYQVPK
jgi:hypothetical protein